MKYKPERDRKSFRGFAGSAIVAVAAHNGRECSVAHCLHGKPPTKMAASRRRMWSVMPAFADSQRWLHASCTARRHARGRRVHFYSNEAALPTCMVRRSKSGPKAARKWV